MAIAPELVKTTTGLAKLGREILQAASDHSRTPSSDRKTWAMLLLSRCLDTYESIRTLVDHRQVVDALALTRVLYDAFVSFLYIYEGTSDPEQQELRILAWRSDGLRESIKRERHLVDLGLATQRGFLRDFEIGLNEIETELAHRGGAGLGDPSRLDKTKAIDVEATYAIIFREASGAIHSTPLILTEYLLAGSITAPRRMEDRGSVVLIAASKMIARMCATTGEIAGIDTSDRAGYYSARLDLVDHH